MKWKAISTLLAICFAYICPSIVRGEAPDQLHTEAGQIVHKCFVRDDVCIGEYYQYLPAGSRADYEIAKPIGINPLPIVVVVHGSIGNDEEARGMALRYLRRYSDPDPVNNTPSPADTERFAVIAPVFSQSDYGGREGPLGGYRGMIGRHREDFEPRKTDPDGFINGILNSYLHKHPEVFSRKTLFYGHSAGGQFLSRYVVTHPDRVAAMVISSAGTYPFPDSTFLWTDGMGSLRKTIQWSTGGERDFAFSPSSSLFRRAARLPVTVVVGDSEDPLPVPEAQRTPGFEDHNSCPGSVVNCPHPTLNCQNCPQWSPTGLGTNYARGQLWVQAMQDFAGLSASDPGIGFLPLSGVQHNSAQTQPEALPILMTDRPTHFSIDWLGSAMAAILLH